MKKKKWEKKKTSHYNKTQNPNCEKKTQNLKLQQNYKKNATN